MGIMKSKIWDSVSFITKCSLTGLFIYLQLFLFAQTDGDYISYQNGNWETASTWQVYSSGSWITATDYPGQYSGDYIVTIAYGHNITISNAGITTESFNQLVISGCLTLSGENVSVNFIINAAEIYVTPDLTPYATILFINKCVLWLPQDATVSVWAGGLSGECNNNQEIRIGPDAYSTFAYCNGAPGNIFTFDELMEGGGTLNAEMSASESSICLSETISLTGGYLGAVETSPTFLWTSSGPDVLEFTSSSTVQNPTITPVISGTYIVKLTVQTTNEGTTYSNTDSIEIVVEQISADPTTINATLTTIMIGCSTTLTLSGGGGTTEQINWYSSDCGTGFVGTGNNLIVSPTEQTTYYARYENAEPCNNVTTCSQITINVVPFANVWEGSVSTDFSTASNWQGNVVPLNGENLLFAEVPVNNCVLDKDFTVGVLSNSSDKHFIVGNNSLAISDEIDFSSTGKMYADEILSKIVFSDSLAQSLDANIFYDNKISDLEIRNQAGVSLNGDINLFTQLKLTNGDFRIFSNTLRIGGCINGTSGTIIGGNTSNLELVDCDEQINLAMITVNNLTLNSASGLLLTGNINVQGILDLNSGILNVDNNQLIISGSIQRTTGSIDAGATSAQIEFANSSVISIPIGAFSQEIYNLKINGAGVFLTEDFTISNTLEFVSGNIKTNENTVILTDLSNAVIGAGPEKCIDGYCRKIGNTLFEFPVGNDSIYAPISISDAQGGGNSSDYFTASYCFQMPNDLYDSTQYEPDIVRISEMEYWILDRSGTNDVSVSLSWDARSGHISDISKLTVARWDGSTWRDEGNSTTSGAKSGTITSEYVSSFSPFTLASKDYGENLLPVGLVSFDAICVENSIEIVWETASEKNNDYFELERSEDSKNWCLLERIEGAGNTCLKNTYSIIDNKQYSNTVFYRLKQFDFNGSVEMFKMIYLEKCNNENLDSFQLFPNPATDYIQIEVSNLVKVEILDILGNLVLVSEKQRIDVSRLSSGVYFVNVDLGHNSVVKRLIVN